MQLFITIALTGVAIASIISEDHSQPWFHGTHSRDTAIPNSYLVKLKDDTTESIATQHLEWLQQLHTTRSTKKKEIRRQSGRQAILNNEQDFNGLTYSYDLGDSFRGYAVYTSADVIDQIRRHPDVRPFSYLMFISFV